MMNILSKLKEYVSWIESEYPEEINKTLVIDIFEKLIAELEKKD